jgi:hypothetical protein
MIPNPIRWAAGLACLLVAPLVLSLPLPESKAKPGAGPVSAVIKPPASPALKVHVDPATGRIIPPPAKPAPDAAANARFSSAHDGLVEEPGATAAGGFKVEARGRFRSAVTLQSGPDGKRIVTCADETIAPSR